MSFSSSLLQAQTSGQSHWELQHLTTENGLSNRFVNGIIQDHRGFTWIATNFGLNRYDGQHIDVLTRESHHLQTNTVFNLFVDINQNIWVVHKAAYNSRFDYIDILDPISFKVKPLQAYLDAPLPFAVQDIRWIGTDLQCNNYILTADNVVYKFDRSGLHRFLQLPADKTIHEMSIYSNSLFVIFKDWDWIEAYTSEGKMLYRIPLPFPSDIERSPYTNWHRMGELQTGKMFMLITDKRNNSRYYAELDSNGMSSLYPIRNEGHKNLYIGFNRFQQTFWGIDGNGIYILDPKKLDKIYPDPGRNLITQAFFCDSIGNTWIGTTEGVVIFSPKVKYFTSFLTRNEPSFYSCRGMAETKNGDIYLLTYNGNLIFHPEDQVFEEWPILEIGLAAITDSWGNIWYTGESHYLFKYDPSTGKKDRWAVEYQSGYFSSWAVSQIRDNQIWMGSLKGLWIKDARNDQPLVKFDKLNGYDALDESAIFHLLERDEGIWLCTDNGLFLVDPDRGVLEHIDEQRSGLPNNNLLFLHIDSAGTYWLASRGGGLIHWDRDRNLFRSYTINEGLSHNVIYAIFEDDYGFLWMPSDLGLMRFEKETGTIRTFLQNEGIPHEEFNRTSYLKDSQGNFYFGTLNGFIRFHPKDMLQVNAVNLPVKLTKFEAINEKTGHAEDLTFQVETGAQIELPSQTSSFLIHYSILDYDDPQLKRYAYRIDGINTNWTYLTENFLRLTGLNGGDYKLRIKGQSSTGRWSSNELVIPVTILKPFFARTWVQLVILLIVAALGFLYYRRRLALQKTKLERERAITNQLRKVDKLKDQFLANTSHELRTPLNGIVGLSESLLSKINTSEEKEDLELIISSGRRLSNLVNDILDFSRLKEHDLELKKKAVDIRAIADLCIRMNRHSLKDKSLELLNDIPETLPYCLADENRIQQILQNLVANAIKFTHEGTVSISAKEREGMIEIAVADTGIGIEKIKQEAIFNEFEQADGSVAREFGGTGLGLSISKYLIELHGGTIRVNSEPGKGSTFLFTVPLYHGEPDQIHVKDKPISVTRYEHTFKASSAIREQKLATNGSNGSRRNILVVDDEPVNLKVLKNHLEQEGYAVTMANDGQEALHFIDSGQKFHLVLLDVMMPRIPGYEVCQKIRERYLLSELPVVMVTAKNQVNDLVQGFGIGANDYIVKPFSKDELLARVKMQLDAYDIHEATGRFVPHEFIHTLGRQNIMDLHRGDMVERNVDVMFSDIRDYTTLAEDMTPEENFKFVNSLAGKIGPLVKQHHGMINQYLGDTIMMLFMEKGEYGIRTGIDILRLIEEYNLRRKAKGRRVIQLGLGLHSGPLMMGIIGDTGRTDAAVISDTVNTASRMEGLTKHFHVNFVLSGEYISKLEDKEAYQLRYLGKVQAKGKAHPISVYECFEGDHPDQRKLKQQTLEMFHEGMESYYRKDMLHAVKCFQSVSLINPADLTAAGFVQKVQGNLIHGLGENWTGIEMMLVK